MLIVSHPKSVKGSNNGNDNTGNKDPFECAFEMIAAIAVMHAEIPKLEIKIIVQNNSWFFTMMPLRNTWNSITAKILSNKPKMKV